MSFSPGCGLIVPTTLARDRRRPARQGYLVAQRRSGRDELEPATPAREPTGGGRWEMRRAHRRRRVAEAAEYLPPRLPALFGIEVGAHAEVGIARLQRRMDHVAGEDRILA